MSVVQDIVVTWRRPARVMRRLLDMGRREDRALMILMFGCGLIFVSQWPDISRQVALDPDGPPLEARIMITFFTWLMVWPIFFYLIGGLTHLIARLFGGKGSFYAARLALFWTILATSPAWLFYGLVRGFVGPGPAEQITGAILLFAFVAIWGICLRVAETRPDPDQPAEES